MLRLMLLRHAKASRDDTDLPDIERPLEPRGERQAEAMGAYIARHRLEPAAVLCSPARRTRETWARVSSHLVPVPPAREEARLYDFRVDAPFAGLVQAEAAASPLLIIGHNASLEAFAKRLINAGDAKLRTQLSEKYPTCTLAMIDFAIERWSDLRVGSGRLAAFVRPKDLGVI